MLELQNLFSGWLSGVVEALPVGYAFGAGMMATASPCGFSMLPAYLSLYLGSQEEDFRARATGLRLQRALLVAGVVSAGFIFTFLLVGGLLAAGARFLTDWLPWGATAIGVGMAGLGLWMLAGRRLPAGVFLRISARIGDTRRTTVRGFLLYGVAYAFCSLSCTLPVFLVVVASSVAAGGALAGAAQFLSYGLGMGLVILVLTVSLAFCKEGLVLPRIRRAMPYLHVATAWLVLLTGIYLVYYWWGGWSGPA